MLKMRTPQSRKVINLDLEKTYHRYCGVISNYRYFGIMQNTMSVYSAVVDISVFRPNYNVRYFCVRLDSVCQV